MEAKMLNNQTPEKIATWQLGDHKIDLHSVFKTIQGEGPFAGTPCVFVRLAGCNLQCPKCDTEYTKGDRKAFSYGTILDKVARLQKGGLIVVTGGEPFRQPNLFELLHKFVDAGYYVQIETNGTLPIPEPANRIQKLVCLNPASRFGIYIVCSPKTGNVHKSVQAHACAFKYVGGANDLSIQDGLPITALDHSAKPILYRHKRNDVMIYLQPLDEKDITLNDKNTQACVQSCIKYGYTLQLQIHKIIDVE